MASGAERKVASYPTSLSALSWFPDGKRVLVYGFHYGAAYREREDASEVIAVDVATGQRQNLVRAGGERMFGSVSPDGSQVAFLYDGDDVRYPDLYEVALVPSAGGPHRSLTPKVLARGRPVWTPDGRGVYYVSTSGAFRQIFFVSTAGEIKQITSSAATTATCASPPTGNTFRGRKKTRRATSDSSSPGPTAATARRSAISHRSSTGWRSARRRKSGGRAPTASKSPACS